MDKFTDSVGARFSLDDARRLTGGVGAVVETDRTWDGGMFSLRGSVDVEQKLGDAETTVDVSGERLASESTKTRLLFGLGGVYRKGRFSVSGEVSVGGLGSDDTQYSGRVSSRDALLGRSSVAWVAGERACAPGRAVRLRGVGNRPAVPVRNVVRINGISIKTIPEGSEQTGIHQESVSCLETGPSSGPGGHIS